jgi:hypothetical protein
MPIETISVSDSDNSGPFSITVTAVNSAGESVASDLLTIQPFPPLAITDVSVSNQGIITFTDPNTGSDTFAYYYNTDGGSSNLGSITNGGAWPDNALTTIYIFVKDTATNLISSGTMVTYTAVPVNNICFIAGTPILTDQGLVPIDKIDIIKHTIGSKPIVAVTYNKSIDDFLVCFVSKFL